MITIVNQRSVGRIGEYIGRPSLLGNPYHVAEHGRAEAIQLYRRWLWVQVQERTAVYDELVRLARIAQEGDLVLRCWCVPQPCHGEIVARAIEWLIETRQI